MKKIVPFNNVLTFSTDVHEITAISLEHDIKTSPNSISGTFNISGEYKMAEGELKHEPFSFELPFDIALGCNYNLDTLVVDIDDFRYELTDSNKMKVNIDLFIDGEEEPAEDLFTKDEVKELTEDEEVLEPTNREITDRIDLVDDIVANDKEDIMEEAKNEPEVTNENNNINIFNGFNEEEKYVTYHVYPFTENDTLEKVLEKYQVSKEELAKYNNLDEIHVGDKLIIPTSNNDK